MKSDFDAASHLDIMSAALNLPVSAERRAGVEQFLNVAYAMSQVVQKAPVNLDICELAAVFRPGSAGVTS